MKKLKVNKKTVRSEKHNGTHHTMEIEKPKVALENDDKAKQSYNAESEKNDDNQEEEVNQEKPTVSDNIPNSNQTLQNTTSGQEIPHNEEPDLSPIMTACGRGPSKRILSDSSSSSTTIELPPSKMHKVYKSPTLAQLCKESIQPKILQWFKTTKFDQFSDTVSKPNNMTSTPDAKTVDQIDDTLYDNW